MTTLQDLKEVAAILREKFSFIKDLELTVYPELKIQGGFYWMNYDGTPHGKYAFHETFIAINSTNGTDHSVQSLVEYATKNIVSQLEWQKSSDETYAIEAGNDVQYMYDYTLIP